MTRDDMIKYTHLEPFRPVVVRCNTGDRFVLRSREHFWVGSTVLVLRDSKGEEHVVSLSAITSLSWLRNGRRAPS